MGEIGLIYKRAIFLLFLAFLLNFYSHSHESKGTFIMKSSMENRFLKPIFNLSKEQLIYINRLGSTSITITLLNSYFNNSNFKVSAFLQWNRVWRKRF